MKRISFILSVAAALALTLASGVVQGHLRNRWGASEAMLAAAENLQKVPMQFGGPNKDRWIGKSEEMDKDSLEMLECTGYIQRSYVNQHGDKVDMFVIVGPAGPIAAHTPEVCFSTQDYKSPDARQPVPIPDDKAENRFWALTFEAKNDPRLIRVYYAWSTGGPWSAPPGDARLAFLGFPYLYKIQLSSVVPAGAVLKDGDACQEFLKDFVPALKDKDKHYIVEPPKRKFAIW